MKRAGLLMAGLMAAVMLCSCASEQKQELHVATKPMTEQYILGEMLKAVIEDQTDLEVTVTKGVGGGTANIHPGMLSGDFDLYPEYTCTGWLNVLKETEVPEQEDELFEQLQQRYQEEFQLEWVGLYGFNNTYCLLVDTQSAQEYGLEKCSDLAGCADQLIFGANYDYYERPDGFPALCETYGLSFKETKDVDMGLKYTIFGKGEINVMPAYTTDAQMATADGVVLEDDKGLFDNYYCGTVVRQEVLEEYPQLRDALMLLDGAISNEEMAQMNYQLEIEHRDEADIAREFLLEKGIIAE